MPPSLQIFPAHERTTTTKTQAYLYSTINNKTLTMRTGITTAMLAMADAAHAAITPSSYSNSADLCGGKLVQDKGNQYCQKVQRIAYENMGKAGSYEQVVHMDQETGDCEFAPVTFSGQIAPFDNPVSPASLI
jgi:hypothetical protein